MGRTASSGQTGTDRDLFVVCWRHPESTHQESGHVLPPYVITYLGQHHYSRGGPHQVGVKNKPKRDVRSQGMVHLSASRDVSLHFCYITNVTYLIGNQSFLTSCQSLVLLIALLKVHKIENFFYSDFGICVISLLVRSKY
jgi:hypothetical protein